VRLIPSSANYPETFNSTPFHPRHCGFRRNPESDSQRSEIIFNPPHLTDPSLITLVTNPETRPRAPLFS
jgi:hypothetical protein